MHELLQAILGGTYTSAQLSRFVEKCHALALPFIRKKIALGKLNPDLVGLNERDIILDCIADLFARNPDNKFPQIVAFFNNHLGENEIPSEAKLTMLLRQLVLGKINQNIIRFYLQLDPAFGRILRNVRLGLERTTLFVPEERFGELMIYPNDADPLLHATPFPVELLRQYFTESVLVHDTVPAMLKKLHVILLNEKTYQRCISVTSVALMIKEVYALEGKVGYEDNDEYKYRGEENDIADSAGRVCSWLDTQKRLRYVGKGKVTDAMFDRYLAAIREILCCHFGDGQTGERSYFEHLHVCIPEMSREEYNTSHRTILEYLAQLGKQRMQQELQR